MFVNELWIPQSYIFFALDDSLTISATLSLNSHTIPWHTSHCNAKVCALKLWWNLDEQLSNIPCSIFIVQI